MILNQRATNVFERNYDEFDSKNRFVVNQGGRGSSKTWSLAQLFLWLLISKRNYLLTVCRKTLPALKATAMRDFFMIMKNAGIYREEFHNKTELIYKMNTNEIEFVSIDQPQKIRGRKRQYLWMNEANEFSYEDFRQLNLRTEKQVFMDYNPSDEFHWIYDHVLTREDAKFIKSTYLDNPFLEPEIVKEIERLKGVDHNYWRIYGLGERGISEATIYNHWELCDKMPEVPDEIIYGLDFGFNNPTALVKIAIQDGEYYLEEILYQSHLTNQELINKLRDLDITEYKTIYADSAEPARISEIDNAGFFIEPADKDVKKGIDTIRTNKIHITKSSINLLKEIKSYKWKVKDEKPLDEPVKENDHLMDSMRYAIYTNSIKPQPGIAII